MTDINTQKPKLTPDEIVEESILTRLKNEGLADEESIKKLKGGLATGLLKIEDWNFTFDVSLEKSRRNAEKNNEH